MATTKDGNTCAHIAAAQGSVTVIEELMKFDRQVPTIQPDQLIRSIIATPTFLGSYIGKK